MKILKSLLNQFSHKPRNKVSPKGISRRLEIICLEQRITPTTGTPYHTILGSGDSATGVRGYDASNVLLSGSYVSNSTTFGMWWKGSLETGLGTMYQFNPVVPGQTVTTSLYYGPNTHLFDPSLGAGNIRVVGSYQYSQSPSGVTNHGVMYTGPLEGSTNSANWVGNLDVPSSAVGGATVTSTIPHSTMGDMVVGAYELLNSPAFGNGFLYNIATNTWTVFNINGSQTNETSAYGVWQNGIGSTSYTIAGGSRYQGVQTALLVDYNSSTGEFSNLTFFPPSAGGISHFEGITGRNGGYNLIASTLNGPAFVTVDRLSSGGFGTATYTPVVISGSSFSTGNTVYQNNAIGVYSTGGSSLNVYVAELNAPISSPPLVTGTTYQTSVGSSTVNLYNPSTGQPTGTAVPFPGFNGSIQVASGDFNNDGVADIIAGAGPGGGPAIAVLDSQTGAVIQSFFAFDQAFTGGVFVAVQDFNADGILDIIAGAGPGGGPEVRVFDGSNLRVLRSFYAYAQDFTGGVSVACVDINQDNVLDLVTGAGPGGGPHVKVFDGLTNSIISQWYAYPISFTGGVFVAAGDVGNDGTIEVVTGAGAGGAPVVAIWNPTTAVLLAEFYAYSQAFTGGVRVGIGDGNFDGILDLITGAGPGGGPQVNAFSLSDLALLFSFYSGEASNAGGVYVG